MWSYRSTVYKKTHRWKLQPVPSTNRRYSKADKFHKSQPISLKFPPARALISYYLPVPAAKVSKFRCIDPRAAPFYHPFWLNHFVGTRNPFPLTTGFKYQSASGRITRTTPQTVLFDNRANVTTFLTIPWRVFYLVRRALIFE